VLVEMTQTPARLSFLMPQGNIGDDTYMSEKCRPIARGFRWSSRDGVRLASRLRFVSGTRCALTRFGATTLVALTLIPFVMARIAEVRGQAILPLDHALAGYRAEPSTMRTIDVGHRGMRA
jgi:hypothetical protein